MATFYFSTIQFGAHETDLWLPFRFLLYVDDAFQDVVDWLNDNAINWIIHAEPLQNPSEPMADAVKYTLAIPNDAEAALFLLTFDDFHRALL